MIKRFSESALYIELSTMFIEQDLMNEKKEMWTTATRLANKDESQCPECSATQFQSLHEIKIIDV